MVEKRMETVHARDARCFLAALHLKIPQTLRQGFRLLRPCVDFIITTKPTFGFYGDTATRLIKRYHDGLHLAPNPNVPRDMDPRLKALERPEVYKVRYTAALNAMQVSEKLKVAERQR